MSSLRIGRRTWLWWYRDEGENTISWVLRLTHNKRSAP